MKTTITVFSILIQLIWAHLGFASSFQSRVDSEFGLDQISCRYELVGEKSKKEVIFENGEMDLAACKRKALAALKKSQKYHSKVLVKHSSNKNWISLE